MSLNKYLELDARSYKAKYEFCHDNKDNKSRAFELGEKISLKISLPMSLGATELFIEVFLDDEKTVKTEIEGKFLGRDKTFEEYSFSFELPVGLYFLRPYAIVFGKRIYSRCADSEIIFDGIGKMLQLTVSRFLYSAPEKIYGGIIYHVFVDRFRRGGEVKIKDYNQLIDGEWTVIPEFPEYPGAPLKNNTLYGGTLYGIIEKLDYISSLGCNAIYLSPIFESVSNHKYDTADYMHVDSCFGGDEALVKLIEEAHSRGIMIILDGVFNHTGSDSVYFNKYSRYSQLGAYQSKESKYYSWYDFKEYPNKYTCWWDIDILPRINPDKPACREFFVGNDGVISKYRRMGIDGMRLDVADELSDGFIERIKGVLSQSTENSDSSSILYGEVWEDASNKIAYDVRKKYYLGSELDGVMNYPLRDGLVEYFTEKRTEKLLYYFNDVLLNTPERILHSQMNLLGTHDTERILTILGGYCVEGLSNKELSRLRMDSEMREYAVNRLCSLYAVIATLPGVPSIFYGDEAGLEGYHDPFNRMPYPWGKENTRLIDAYKQIGKIRRDNEIYKSGSFRLLHLDSNLLIFARFDEKYSFITLYNNTDNDCRIEFTEKFVSLYKNQTAKTLHLPAGQAKIVNTSRKTSLIL